MIIPVNDTWRINSDSHQWKCEKNMGKDKQGNTTWISQTFHGSFEQAKKALGHRMIRDLNTETLEDAIEGVKQIHTELEEAISKVG